MECFPSAHSARTASAAPGGPPSLPGLPALPRLAGRASPPSESRIVKPMPGVSSPFREPNKSTHEARARSRVSGVEGNLCR